VNSSFASSPWSAPVSWIAWPSSASLSPATTAARPRSTGTVRQCRAEDYWNLREIFESEEIDIDELDDVLAAPCDTGSPVALSEPGGLPVDDRGEPRRNLRFGIMTED
jgi:hypothetical protein